MPQGTVISSWQKLSENRVVLYVQIPEGVHGELKPQDGWECEGDRMLKPGGRKYILTRG